MVTSEIDDSPPIFSQTMDDGKAGAYMMNPPSVNSACAGRWMASLLLGALLSTAAFGADSLDALRKAAKAEIQNAETDINFKKAELAQKYIGALDGLEKTLSAAGKLDAVLHLREERDAVKKSGETTAHQDKELVDLREKYVKALAVIDDGMKAVNTRVAAGITKQVHDQETALTKAGKVDEALALRKEGETLLLEFSSDPASAAIPFSEDPRTTSPAASQPLEAIKVPAEKPPLVEKPFEIKGRWLESMTLPLAKQRIREAIVIGDRGQKKWPLVVMSPGSFWSGADSGRIELSGCNFVAEKCQFEKLQLGADHACIYYFQRCNFNDCHFDKVGVWYGGDMHAKFYFESCLIKGSLAGSINVEQYGYRIQDCVLVDITLPTMHFQKNQPAKYVNRPWLRVVHSRFVKCKIPLSFVLLTRDCVFEGCTFTNDLEKQEDGEITTPIEITLFMKDAKGKVPAPPANVTFVEKTEADLKGVVIPTVSSLSQ